MIKRVFMFFILSTFILFIVGCGTLKGAYNGFKEDWQALKKVDDWVKKSDDWVKKNMW